MNHTALVQVILLQSTSRWYVFSTASWAHPILGPAEVSYRGQRTDSRGWGGRRTASWAKRLGPTPRKPILHTTWCSCRAEQVDVCRNRANNKNKLKLVNNIVVKPAYLALSAHSWQLCYWSLRRWAGCPWRACFQFPWTLFPAFWSLINRQVIISIEKFLIHPHFRYGLYLGCELPAPTGSAPGPWSRCPSHLGSLLEVCTCLEFSFSWTRSRNTGRCRRCFGSGLYLLSVAKWKEEPMRSVLRVEGSDLLISWYSEGSSPKSIPVCVDMKWNVKMMKVEQTAKRWLDMLQEKCGRRLHHTSGVLYIGTGSDYDTRKGVLVYLKWLFVEIRVVADLCLPGLAEQDEFLE